MDNLKTLPLAEKQNWIRMLSEDLASCKVPLHGCAVCERSREILLRLQEEIALEQAQQREIQ